MKSNNEPNLLKSLKNFFQIFLAFLKSAQFLSKMLTFSSTNSQKAELRWNSWEVTPIDAVDSMVDDDHHNDDASIVDACNENEVSRWRKLVRDKGSSTPAPTPTTSTTSTPTATSATSATSTTPAPESPTSGLMLLLEPMCNGALPQGQPLYDLLCDGRTPVGKTLKAPLIHPKGPLHQRFLCNLLGAKVFINLPNDLLGMHDLAVLNKIFSENTQINNCLRPFILPKYIIAPPLLHLLVAPK